MTGHFAPDEPSHRSDAHGLRALPMPMTYLRLFLRRFGRDADAAAALLEGTGITPGDARSAGPDDTIRVGQQLRQLQNLARLAPPGWALEVGPALQGSAHGALATAIATAPDLRRGLDAMERFGPLRAPYFRLLRRSRASRHEIEIELLLDLEPDVRRSQLELLLLSIQALVESALGEPMGEARFALPFPAPAYADRYETALHAPRVFDAARASVSIPKAWLALPCPFADAAQHAAACAALERAERALAGPASIVARVERVLEGVPGAPPGADEVAARLHLSRRTLVRRLAACGTSFRALADDHRRRRTAELLADGKLTIAEVGDRVGYTDAANFGRAVRRWFGASPSEMREK